MQEPNFDMVFEETFSFNYADCGADIEPDIFPKKRRPNPEEGFQLN